MKHLPSLSDEALLENTLACVRDEREKIAVLVAHLAEVYRRDLALKRGYPSLFKYAREALGLTDQMAWDRTSAAQLAAQMPETIERLASGELTLESARELWRTIRDAAKVPDAVPVARVEKRELFTQVLNKSRTESGQVLQSWAAERRGEAPNLKPRTHTVTVELSDDELARFNQLRDLLSHRLGSRDRKEAFVWMMERGLDQIDPARREARIQARKASRATPPKSEAAQASKNDTSRRSQNVASQQSRRALPAALKRRIWLRDQGKCQHTDPQTGRKCETTAFLDYDHITPHAHGGLDEESNLRLSCASHNRRRYFWNEQRRNRGRRTRSHEVRSFHEANPRSPAGTRSRLHSKNASESLNR